MSRGEILGRLSTAVLNGDRETARSIYYSHVIPNDDFSHREADRLAFRVGAIDEGDRHLADATHL